MTEQTQQQKKGRTGKLILLGLGLIGLGVGGYFAYRHFTKDDGLDASFTPDLPQENESFEPPKTKSGGTQSAPEGFPLKRGSRGKYVGLLQRELARRFGLAVLGRGGIDKIFGRDTEHALTSNGLPSVITGRIFEDFTKLRRSNNKNTRIIKSRKRGITVSEPKELATGLREHILKGRFDLAVDKLEKIQTVKDYDLVNTFFKEMYISGVRKTIVTALLQRFNSAEDKAKLAVHFNRMGLVKSGGKWKKKDGLGNAPKFPKIKTIRQAKVWNIKGRSLRVPPNMILGEFLHAENGVTEFTTLDDKVLFVKTANVSYA